MTSPRSHLVDPDAAGFYHCVSRCVRRAFLCGEDASTGRSYEHRKQWVEDRLLELAEIFAVGIYAYAVMSNHLHVVIYIDPSATVAWSPDDIAQRWVRLTPIRVNGEIDEAACDPYLIKPSEPCSPTQRPDPPSRHRQYMRAVLQPTSAGAHVERNGPQTAVAASAPNGPPVTSQRLKHALRRSPCRPASVRLFAHQTVCDALRRE